MSLLPFFLQCSRYLIMWRLIIILLAVIGLRRVSLLMWATSASYVKTHLRGVSICVSELIIWLWQREVTTISFNSLYLDKQIPCLIIGGQTISFMSTATKLIFQLLHKNCLFTPHFFNLIDFYSHFTNIFDHFVYQSL